MHSTTTRRDKSHGDACDLHPAHNHGDLNEDIFESRNGTRHHLFGQMLVAGGKHRWLMTGVVISECELPRPILIVVAILQFLDRLRRGVEELGEMQLRAINKCDDTAELGLVARTYLRAEINIENEPNRSFPRRRE